MHKIYNLFIVVFLSSILTCCSDDENTFPELNFSGLELQHTQDNHVYHGDIPKQGAKFVIGSGLIVSNISLNNVVLLEEDEFGQTYPELQGYWGNVEYPATGGIAFNIYENTSVHDRTFKIKLCGNGLQYMLILNQPNL